MADRYISPSSAVSQPEHESTVVVVENAKESGVDVSLWGQPVRNVTAPVPMPMLYVVFVMLVVGIVEFGVGGS